MTIDVNASTEIEVLPAARPAQSDAIATLMQHAQAMTAAKQLADALCDSDLVPAIYRGKPGNGAAAILYGAELGLNPIQSLQQIFVVHGAPAIYARTAVALVKRSGILIQTVATSDESVTVNASDPRRGLFEESTWDIGRATRAGYTSNKKYTTDPQAMLYAKAAMEVCRKIAPDVLLGIPYSREELELEQQPVRVRSERGGRGVGALRAAAAADREPSQETVDADPDPESAPAGAAPKPDGLSESARKRWLKSMFALLGEGDCSVREDQLIVIGAVVGHEIEHRDGLTDDELKLVVNSLNAWRTDGVLGDNITTALNAYVAAQADEDTDGGAA